MKGKVWSGEGKEAWSGEGGGLVKEVWFGEGVV